MIHVLGRQKFPDTPIGPAVTPGITFTLEGRADPTSARSQGLFVTKVKLSFLSLDPTEEELLAYDWTNFFCALARFEHLANVEMTFNTPEQRDIMIRGHEDSSLAMAEEFHRLDRSLCKFEYLVDDRLQTKS